LVTILNRSWHARLRQGTNKQLTIFLEKLYFYRECVLFLTALTTVVLVIKFRSELHLLISEHVLESLSIAIAILVPSVGWMVRSVGSRRKERKKIERQVLDHAFQDVAILRKFSLQLTKDKILRFYSGEKLERYFWESLKEDLDFRRPLLARLHEKFTSWDGKKFHECKTPVGEMQGKSLLLGRFAWDLARSSDNRVLWWPREKNYLANGELAKLLINYRKILSRTKKLVVFMDDLLPEEEGDWRLEELNKSSVYNFLQTLISGKLCLYLIAEKCQFMPQSQRNILREKLLPEEEDVLRKISVCSTVSLPYPELAMQNKSTEFWRSMKMGFLKDLLEKVEFQTGDGFYDLNLEKKTLGKGYILIALLFGRQILRERCRIKESKVLSGEYARTLLEIILSAQDQSETSFALEYTRVFLSRLIKNLQKPFYPEFSGLVLAYETLMHVPLKEKVTHHIGNLSDLDEILRWAFTFKRLQYQDSANKLFEKADVVAQKRGARELDLKHIARLAIGLKDSDAFEQKRRSIVYFERVVKRAFKEGSSKLSNQIIDAYVDLVSSLSSPQQALDKLDELVKSGGPGFRADSVLIRRRAQLLEQIPERMREAQKEFKRAIKLAKKDPSSKESLMFALQRYAHFLSQRNKQLDPSFREDPEIYFQEAVDLAKEAGLSYEAILNAWAIHKEEQGDMLGAKSTYEAVIEYCNEKGIVNPFSLLNFSSFLHKYGQLFKNRAYSEWWQIAEDCCRRIIDYEGSDCSSRLHAYHQLGLLMGSSPPKAHELLNGSKRPDFLGAVQMLEKAFESPEPRRMDDSQKTFQDCVTHQALAQTYVRWIEAIEKGNTVESEPVTRLLKKAEFHSWKAFSGLCQRPYLTFRTKGHIIKSQIHYAGFQWFRNRDAWKARANYDEAIRLLESWGLSDGLLELACRSYWYTANFYSYLYKKSGFERTEYLETCEQLYRKALQIMTNKMPRQERLRLRHKAVVCLLQQIQRLRGARQWDVEQQKLDEASVIVEEGLAEGPKNPYLWSVKIPLHIWKNNFDLAMQQLIEHELTTINQCLMTLKATNRQAARDVAKKLTEFRAELKSKLVTANLQKQCSFYALLSVLNPNLGSLLLSDKKVYQGLRERLNSSTATTIANIVGLLKTSSRIEAFSDLCMSLDYIRIVNSSTVTSIYRLLERLLDKKVKVYAECFVKALPNANWANLIAKEDASLYRLNGILDNAKNVGKEEAERLADSLSKVSLNSLFLRTDPAAEARGYTQQSVVNLFVSGRISISHHSATKIVGNVHDQEWLYLFNSATADQGFWLLWNVYRYAPTRAMSLAKQGVAQLLQTNIKDQPILIKLALIGLLQLCNAEIAAITLSKIETASLKHEIKENVAGKRLTLPLLCLRGLKAKLEPERFKECRDVVDERVVSKIIQGNENQNLKELLAKMHTCIWGEA